MFKALKTVGRYIILMGRVFARPERMRMFFRQYVNELEQLGVNSIGIVLLKIIGYGYNNKSILMK